MSKPSAKTFTKKNHYNPCFWTAFWNPGYYRSMVNGGANSGSARDQEVYALNVMAGKIYETKTGSVHYDKNLGAATITREQAEAFCWKYFPQRYEQFCRENAMQPYPVAIDLEQILTNQESLQAYATLLDVIKRQSIAGPMEKVELAAFIAVQAVRSHAPFNSVLQWHSELSVPRFESYFTLKWLLEDCNFIATTIGHLARLQWTLFATSEDSFPLCDSPVLLQESSIFVALSPRLLLEISCNIPASEEDWRLRKGIKPGKLAEFRRRTIGNSFREIIFSDRKVLEYWSRTSEFQQRVEMLADADSYNLRVEENGSKFWRLNVFGNQ